MLWTNYDTALLTNKMLRLRISVIFLSRSIYLAVSHVYIILGAVEINFQLIVSAVICLVFTLFLFRRAVLNQDENSSQRQQPGLHTLPCLWPCMLQAWNPSSKAPRIHCSLHKFIIHSRVCPSESCLCGCFSSLVTPWRYCLRMWLFLQFILYNNIWVNRMACWLRNLVFDNISECNKCQTMQAVNDPLKYLQNL